TVPVDDARTFVPPTAKVRAEMDASFADGGLRASPEASQSAGAWKVTVGELTGETKGRVVAGLPYEESFEAFPLGDDGFAYPPLSWIGARFKWEVREHGGSNVLVKTLDNLLFQRSTVFIGDADEHDYRVSASV